MTNLKRLGNFSKILNFWSNEQPDKIFLSDLSIGLESTYQSFDNLVNSAVSLLIEKGVSKGDIVSISIRNSIDFLILYFASIRIGAIINPIPFSVSESELIKTFNFIEPKLIFLEPSNSKKCSAIFSTFIVSPLEKNFKDMLSQFNNKYRDVELNSEDPCCCYYSSGTTSNPKAILYSHKNMVSLIDSICSEFSHNSNSVHLGILPMGHTAITNYSFLPVLYSGAKMLFSENFIKIRSKFWDIIKNNNITYVETVPTILFTIMNTKYESISLENLKLEYIGCGSAPLPVEVQKGFHQKFGLPVSNLYGLSETGPSHFDNPLSEGWVPGSIGFPLAVNSCVIFDESRKEMADGEIGEIALKGPNIFIGYYKNDKAYREAMYDDYFLTGDLGYKDENGKFFYVDRVKDLIIKGGTNIFPGEIDEVLFSHSSVVESSTIGVPDIFFGEDIVSFVVVNDEISEDSLLKFCNNNLQSLKCPKRIIFLKEIPQTASGKMLKRELKEKYQNEFS